MPASPSATLSLLSCSPNLPRASTHAKRWPFLYLPSTIADKIYLVTCSFIGLVFYKQSDQPLAFAFASVLMLSVYDNV